MCETGLHASSHPFDALQYAPGTTLCKVQVFGSILKESDKLCAQKRRIVARFDATELLNKFARLQALSVIDNWDAPPAVRQYLTTGDESLRRAASCAAWGAARSAVESAVESAARSAVESAAESAAWSAAANAAWSAAWSAAWDAARSAARSAAWSAVESAAWSAAANAAWSAARKQFATMVNAEFKRIQS